MKQTTDPAIHQEREKAFFQHVQAVLNDNGLRVVTTLGRRSVAAMWPHVTMGQPGVARGESVKRLMMQLNLSDRSLQQRMPVGERLQVLLRQRSFWMFKRPVGRLLVMSHSPTESLLQGETPVPMEPGEIDALLATQKQLGDDLPSTVVLMSTSGFSPQALELARSKGRHTLLLAEPNDAGGWTIHAPAIASDLAELFDPEQEQAKRQRIRNYLSAHQLDLVLGSVAADKIAAAMVLPVQTVESELKSYARQQPGLAARKIDGKLMLYREGSASADTGGLNMPFWDNIRSIFKLEESAERKIARLAAERASLTGQRERCYDEIAVVERRESELTKDFQTSTALAQRRIATEISQLRKDLERRQQILSVIDKKVNVINTAVHTLELKQQIDPAKLKKLENIAVDTEEVESGLASLQQLDEEANDSAGIGASEMPEDVQAIMDELRGKTAAEPTTAATNVIPPEKAASPQAAKTESSPTPVPRQRSEPEAG
jgi:division protein CdvB (Snf7/Vps24/ESCRT-III family)